MVAAVAVVVALASPSALASGGGKVIYDSTVKPLPGNLPSVGAEAYSFTELGDEVTFAAGSRQLGRVTVTLSSWGCQAGSWTTGDCVTRPGARFVIPITFNVYSPAASNTAGALLATRTQTFEVPYRPSADGIHCTSGKWFDRKQGCLNGLAANVTFDFSGQHVQLPNAVVYGITYNTSHYGPNPIGQGAACFTALGGCPYDSLNIGLAPKVRVGSKPFPNTVYQNAVYAGDYCDGGAAGIGLMRLDSATNACWFDATQSYIPAVQFAATRGDKSDSNDDNDNSGGDGGSGD